MHFDKIQDVHLAGVCTLLSCLSSDYWRSLVGLVRCAAL